MLSIDRITTIDGSPMRGYFVRNGIGKVVAIGAIPAGDSEGFVMPSRKRYCRDTTLCQSIARLTGQAIKWNLSFYSGVVTSHGPRYARSEYERRRRY